MSKNFVQSALIRDASIGLYRIYAQAQFWRTGPRIFVNSIPKAGTHLLTAELEEFRGLMHSRLHIETRRVNRLGGYERRVNDTAIDSEAFARYAQRVRPGQIFSAHLPWEDGVSDYLSKNDFKILFMTRDPRDIVMSALHYIVGLKRHHLHSLFVERFTTDAERLRVLVLGHDDAPYVRPLRETIKHFAPWTEQGSVLTVRFEDLVGPNGGGDPQTRLAVLSEIAAFCGLSPKGLSNRTMTAPKPTPTLRSGKAYGWRKAMPVDIVELISDECGPLIRAMGYS